MKILYCKSRAFLRHGQSLRAVFSYQWNWLSGKKLTFVCKHIIAKYLLLKEHSTIMNVSMAVSLYLSRWSLTSMLLIWEADFHNTVPSFVSIRFFSLSMTLWISHQQQMSSGSRSLRILV